MQYFCKICGSPLPTDFTQECPCLSQQPKPTTLYWRATLEPRYKLAEFTLSPDYLKLKYEKWTYNKPPAILSIVINQGREVNQSREVKLYLTLAVGNSVSLSDGSGGFILIDLHSLLTNNPTLSLT